MNKERMFGADGLLVSANNRGQRVIVPEHTLDMIQEAGGLANIEGKIIELIPEVPGQAILPIYDIFVPLFIEPQPNNN